MCTFTDRMTHIIATWWRKLRAARNESSSQSPKTPVGASGGRNFIALVHPFLLAVLPILVIYVQNYSEADTQMTYWLSAASLLMVAVVLGVSRLLLADWIRAAVWTSAFTLLFYSYGRVFDAVAGMRRLNLTGQRLHWIIGLTSLAIL